MRTIALTGNDLSIEDLAAAAAGAPAEFSESAISSKDESFSLKNAT